MSKSLLHDWESSIEKNKNNTEELLKIAEDIYNTAYARGKASTERPQGEWEESHIFSCGNILRMGMDVIEHKCKNCGRWSIKWVRTIPDNFCSNCGLPMKKGGAE